jgi:hypothetical protein
MRTSGDLGLGNAKGADVLVFPAASGINDMTYRAAMLLGEEGYVALACDMFA